MSSSNIQNLAAAAGLGGASRDALGDEMKQCNDSLEALLSSYEAILAHSRQDRVSQIFVVFVLTGRVGRTFTSAGDCTSEASLRWHVEKMTQSSESLLQMISNLKISAVANDTPAMNQRIDQRTEELKAAEAGLVFMFVFLGHD